NIRGKLSYNLNYFFNIREEVKGFAARPFMIAEFLTGHGSINISDAQANCVRLAVLYYLIKVGFKIRVREEGIVDGNIEVMPS
ncbi:MAG: hypothetical protein IMF01_01485, partial [Proteobacteria bacterium]|nr:hypothetical protein [Pseudomonadota bacterium]